MSNVLQIVENEKTSEFYPTPPTVVEKMLQGIKWERIETVLEPSAGKGDILREIARKEGGYYDLKFDIDCIEIDPNLRQVLKYSFSEERKDILKDEEDKLSPKTVFNSNTYNYDKIPSPNPIKLQQIKEERQRFFKNGIHIVHDDFLTYTPFKQYDLIIMNPPFSNGDKHLLKALQIQENGGKIVCLLNAETIRNPYTETRKNLVEKLEKYEAEIEYIENAFMSAERQTAVEVALIRVDIPFEKEESDIFKRMQEAEEVEDFNYESTELEVTDIIKATINRYRVEVKSGLELIRQYRAMSPYLKPAFDEEGCKYDKDLLVLKNKNGGSFDFVSQNEYVKDVRLKYWKALLSNQKFVGKLTAKMQQEYREKVYSFANYEYSEFNIFTLMNEINSQVKTGIEEEIIKMFDRLTDHSYFPECQKTIHYFNGWKTNMAHKIGKKVILPCYGVFSRWSDTLYGYEARKVLEDIEKILNYFDGSMMKDVDFWHLLENCFKQGITKNIQLKYFTATFYKKGTVHLTFNCPELIERFNIYAAQQKAWLPPNYGKKEYKNMSEEEKAVIDSFQGEKAYNEVMEKAHYYLAPVVNNQVLKLEG